jgi:hypothetical protein
MRICVIVFTAILVSGCGENWSCVSSRDTMYSISDSGKLGSAEKGCTCEQISSFEKKKFGRVDEQALRADFGC